MQYICQSLRESITKLVKYSVGLINNPHYANLITTMRDKRISGYMSTKEYEDRYTHENTKNIIAKIDLHIYIIKIKRKVARDKFHKVLEKRLPVRNVCL